MFDSKNNLNNGFYLQPLLATFKIMVYVPPLTYLTEKEYRELLGLEYVLTWHYSDDMDRDDKRYRELSNKRWGE